MQIVHEKIALLDLKQMADASYGQLVKAVIDIEKEVMAIDADLHSDEEAFLLEQGSKQEHLWGVNLYPDLTEDQWIEFDSMINVRPGQGNRSRGVDDLKVQQQVIKIVTKLVVR